VKESITLQGTIRGKRNSIITQKKSFSWIISEDSTLGLDVGNKS
jgi:hypothetical protein